MVACATIIPRVPRPHKKRNSPFSYAIIFTPERGPERWFMTSLEVNKYSVATIEDAGGSGSRIREHFGEARTNHRR